MQLDHELAFRLPMMTGDDVRLVQQALARANMLNASADGIFGPATRTAVIRFQTQLHQRNPAIGIDGIVGRDTWSALFTNQTAVQPAPGVQVAPAVLLQDTNWRAGMQPYLDRLAQEHAAPVGRGARRWRLTPEGVEIAGIGVRGSGGRPQTAARVWRDFRVPIEKCAAAYGVPLELIVATICTESGGNPRDVREEPGYISDEATPMRVSPGLMQTLIGTAREVTRDATIDRARLLDPETSIRAGTALIKQHAIRRGAAPTDFDPPLVAIAYNAGSLQPNASNAWGLRQTARPPKTHADCFVEFFNDCIAVLQGSPLEQRPSPQTPGFWALQQRG